MTAAPIAYTSFENETVYSGSYTDTGDAAADHDLVNNSGQPIVDSTVATEWGYNASYVNSRDGVGLTDGDYVGVTDYTTAVGSYTDGSQGYQMSDCDGQMVLTFNAVDISGYTDVRVSLDLFVADTGYEATDYATVTAQTDVGNVVLYNNSDTGLETDAGSWMNLSADIDDLATSVTLVVAFDSNSGNEAIYLDNASVIPEPATLGLVAVFGAGLMFVRRSVRI